jgi:hypothetical protein
MVKTSRSWQERSPKHPQKRSVAAECSRKPERDDHDALHLVSIHATGTGTA